MKKIESSLFCAFLIGLTSINLNAAEDLGLITVESSTIDISNSKKTNISSSSIISNDRIEKVNIKNINDVLKAVPGVTLSTRTGEMAQIHFRGVGQQQFMGENSGVAIVVDGVPVMQQAGGIRLNLKDIESIKVIKGSASYLYGDTALSGALIITTKKPKGNNSIDIELIGGSHNFRDSIVSLYNSSDSYALNMNASYRKTDGYWKDSELWTKSINGKFSYFLDDTSDISFSADISDKYDQAGGRSIIRGVTEAKNNPRGKGNSYSKDNYIDLDKYILSYNKDFENNSNLLVSTYFYKDFYEYLSNPKDLDSNPMTPEKYTQNYQKNLKQYGVKAEYRLDEKNYASMFGLEVGKRDFQNIKDITENYSNYDRRKRRNINYYNGESTLSKDEELIAGLYTEFKYNFTEDLTGTFNVRYDKQKKKYSIEEKDFNGTSWRDILTSDKKSFSNASYRLGATYSINDNNELFSSISTAFETPDVMDLDSNPDVEEQTSINYELGLRGEKGIFFYEASVFQLDNKDIIGPEGGTYSFGDLMDNAGDTRSRGLEFLINSDKNKTLSFELAYSYLSNKYTKYNTFKHTYQDRSTHDFNIVGNTVPRSSKHTVNIMLNYKLTPNLELIPEVYAKSSYYADETNIVKMPGYAIFNLQTRYKTKFLNGNLELFAKVNNIFDKQYYRAAYLHRDKRGELGIDKEDASIVVDPGREFYFGIKYSF